MIISPRLPQINGLLGKLNWNSSLGQHLQMMMIGILHHRGRMSAQQVASAIVGQSRHRAAVGRFLKRHGRSLKNLNGRAWRRLLALSGQSGRYVFIVDTTNVSHQGEHTENTFSTANHRRRPAKVRRYQKRRYARRGCHAFVWGCLLTPDGKRLPVVRSYYTREYCEKHQRSYSTQADLAAELVRGLVVPPKAEVIVLGDTSFESQQMREACRERGFYWIMPANPERVLEDGRPRPKLWSLAHGFSSRMFAPVRLSLGEGRYAAMRRTSRCRQKSNKKSAAADRTFYVHEERRAVHSIGEVRIVFSTKQKPQTGKGLNREETKVLLSNAEHLTVAEIVELYLLRWQIELLFKELKSCLGMHQYRFRDFACVETWMEAFRLVLLYLEWIRSRRMRGAKTTRERSWWSRQRTHGLSLAVTTQLVETQLLVLKRSIETPTGIKKLRRKLRAALAKEYQNAA
jgi:Transposase DDE domain